MKPESTVMTETRPDAIAPVEGMTEKRAHSRIFVSVSVEIVDRQTEMKVTGRVTDLGIGGCYVDTLNTFPKDTPVDISLFRQEQTLQLRAVVAYIVNDKGIGMGLSFTSNPASSRAKLLEWLRELGGESRLNRTQTDVERPKRIHSKLTRTQILEEVVDDLLTLLMYKGVLTAGEVTQFRHRISGG
jgi:hypothetical protein